MNMKKIHAVTSLADQERLDYFIRKVADFEEVWGAYENGWLILGSKSGDKVIPFWPEEDFANYYIIENKLTVTPKKISLEDLLSKWVPGMKKDNTDILVFPVQESQGVVLKPSELAKNIEDELEQYN